MRDGSTEASDELEARDTKQLRCGGTYQARENTSKQKIL